MKKKEVEDVIGGKDAWENVDKADGEFCGFFYLDPSPPKARRGRA